MMMRYMHRLSGTATYSVKRKRKYLSFRNDDPRVVLAIGASVRDK